MIRFTLGLVLAVTACAAAAPDATSLKPKLKQMAKAGNAEAAYHLGTLHQVGISVPVDHQKALTYFRTAAAAGDPLAHYKIGCFYDGQDQVLEVDEAAALKHKLIAAEAGYALAQQDVAAHYARNKNWATADRWLLRAASQGIPEALLGYATIHNGENGLPRDGVKLVAYFTLFMASRDASPEQKAWLDQQRASLATSEQRRADQLVAQYHPEPTALTMKALSGLRAATALVENLDRK